MIKFIQNKNTGILEVWENNKKKGEIITMGDEVMKDGNGRKRDESKRRNTGGASGSDR